MNVAVINIKHLFKYIIKFMLILILITFFISILKILKISKSKKVVEEFANKNINISENFYKEILNLEIPFINNELVKKEYITTSSILNNQIKALNFKTYTKEKEENNQEENIVENTEKETNQIISKNVQTEVVSENNIIAKVTDEFRGVEINNQCDYEITEDMLNPDSIEITNKKDVIIYHTHTCESYTPSENYQYEMTGNYRTTDLNFSVARVGEELKNLLENKGFLVNHNTTYHDYPAYSGSYDRAADTIRSLMEGEDTQIVIDLHRDAVGSSNEYGPTIKVNDTKVAQLMFVIGTNGGGLEHPNWNENLKFAVKVQLKANEMYPGLFRPIIIRNSRYNQNVAKGASIIEVGATGNTMDECLLSMQCLANVLEETLK